MRIPSYAVWEVAVFVLNVLAFILVGFQLKPSSRRLDRPTRIEYAGVAARCAPRPSSRASCGLPARRRSAWRCRQRSAAGRGPADAVALSRAARAWSALVRHARHRDARRRARAPDTDRDGVAVSRIAT